MKILESAYLKHKDFYLNNIGTKNAAKQAFDLLDKMDCVKALQVSRAIVEVMEFKVRESFGEVV